MAESPDARTIPVTTQSLIWIVSCAAIVIGTSLAASAWVDDRIDGRVDTYVNKYILPRIVSNERDISEIKKQLEKLSQQIETSDNSRNRQYGELKSNQEKTLKVLESVTVMGVRSQ